MYKQSLNITIGILACLIIGLGTYLFFIRVVDHHVYIVGTDAKFSGTITASNCPNPVADMGCSITVNGYQIVVRLGFINKQMLGTVTGLDIIHNPIIGQTADVYAKIVTNSSASIEDDTKYYVHIH